MKKLNKCWLKDIQVTVSSEWQRCKGKPLSKFPKEIIAQASANIHQAVLAALKDTRHRNVRGSVFMVRRPYQFPVSVYYRHHWARVHAEDITINTCDPQCTEEFKKDVCNYFRARN